MRLLSLSALCIAAFVAVQAQDQVTFTSTLETAEYCKESCVGNTQWTPDECLELCLDYYDTHPLPSQPSYPGDIVMTMTQNTVPKRG